MCLSLFPQAWGFTSANLPPLGASPDGLIIHTVLAPAHQVRCLVAADQALKQGAANAQHDAAQLNQLRFQAQQTVRELLKLVAVACPAGSDAASAGSGASAGGSDGEEAATAGQACQHPAAGQRSRQPDEEEDDENEEIILYRMVELSSAPSAQGGARTPEKQPAAGKQRARGAQPASSSQQAAAATLRAAQSESSAADAVRAALNGLQRINLADAAAGPRNGDRSHGSSALDPAAPAATNGTKAHAAAAAAAPNRRQPPSAPVQQSRPGMEEALAPVVLREIVEIKNTFPYGRRNRRSGAKGKTISGG